MAPSTFASAAAGNNSNSAAPRQDGTNEWARRANGATQTFRRSSNIASQSSSTTAPSTTSVQQRDPSSEPQSARYVPPHRNGLAPDTRYSRDQLIGLLRSQNESGAIHRDSFLGLTVGGWEPDSSNGHQDHAGGWQRRDEARDNQGTDTFWDSEGSIMPKALVEMTEQERDLFSSSVNSPLKQMVNNNNNREATGKEGHMRRISVSNNPNSPGAFAMNSPTVARSGNRRRDGNESYPFPSQGNPKPRDDNRTNSPPPSLRRRATDFKDLPAEEEELAEDKYQNRGAINPIGAGMAPSSPWGVQPSPGFAPMGAFGSFGNTTPGEKRPGLTGGRAESRFKGLMSRDSTDDFGKAIKEKTPGKSGEASNWRSGWGDSARGTGEQETEAPTGSAALGGGEEISPPLLRGLQSHGTPQRPDTRDNFGFAAFGMTPDTGMKSFANESHLGLRGNGKVDALSPTNTNPYRSPGQENEDTDDPTNNDDELSKLSLRGLGGIMGEDFGQIGNNFGGGFQAFGQAPGDRSQTSSVGPRPGFSGLGGLGPLPGLGGASGWGIPPPAAATPSRSTHVGLGDHGFGSALDLQSPGLAGLGSSSLFGAGQSAAPGAGRGVSRMFHQPVEAPRAESFRQMQDEAPNAFGEADSKSMDSEQQDSTASNMDQPSAAQQRTMVMPDRIRWIYRDPQGNTQGPWSGLEMHDWYKAGFFSPELLVKKAEDPEYEPLAQLIRRIGNSREPFLVPQIGIPHGPPSANWAPGANAGQTGQPPFAASFPSFGTTLTADQQNALERRKQEEQFLMARQKEALAQQQMAQRMQFQQHPGGIAPHVLHHHASAQSLQSQPSMSSVNSAHAFPNAQMNAGPQGPQYTGFMGNNAAQQQPRPFGAPGANVGAGIDNLGHIREEGVSSEFEKLQLQQHGSAAQPQQRQQQVNAMLDDRANLQAEQAQHDASVDHKQEAQTHAERLQEFHRLQQEDSLSFEQEQYTAAQPAHQTPTKEPRSLTEQVQQAVSAQQSPSAWGKVDPALPQPFPPAPSQSPLPAPAAQRNRSHVADALHAESHSRSDTPSTETERASVAPWAKEPAEAPRGPSLKEIQELEAKKAAEAEAIAAESRRLQLEKEAQAQAAAAAAAAAAVVAGLPSSSTWGNTGAASPSVAGTPWAKAAKPVATPPSAKSMAQIQKEEEARKKRLAAAAAAQQQAAVLAGAAAQAQGKRYAELASKIASPVPAAPSTPQAGGAWTTVGSSGKVKVPGTTTPAPVRPAVAAPPPAAAVKKPAPVRSATTGSGAAVNVQDEFKRWAANELRADLKKGVNGVAVVNAEEFVSNLLNFPLELDLVTEAVHSVSTTIDSRHFAEEFLRRRKQADRGVFETNGPSPANAGGAGWSEVAKKGGKVDAPAAAPSVTDDLAAFKVVAAKKKGKR